VNNSDDTTTVTTKPIGLDIILNQQEVVNNKDFYNKNSLGDKLENTKQKLLFEDIDKFGNYPIYP